MSRLKPKKNNIFNLFKNSNTSKRVVFVVFIFILSLACYNVVSSYYMHCDQTLSKLDAIAKTLAGEIDGDAHELLTSTFKNKGDIKTNDENAIYSTIYKKLAKAQQVNNLNSEISTLIYNEKTKTFYFVVNSSNETYYLDTYSQNTKAFLKLYKTGGKIPEYKDEYSTWLTALAPIKDSKGNVVAIIEVDEKYKDFLGVIDKQLYIKIAIGVLIFSFTAFFLLRYLKQILMKEEKIKHELELSYDVINQHNEDMLNSINYAKKIQTAILPPNQEIKRNLPNSFIHYLPKDIVSGDFYFFKEITKGEKFIIAACDCTGHGVPGALMSVIGSNFLEHIINSGIQNPAGILTHLNKAIINTLKQDNVTSESRDGMDVAICLIDKTQNTITYAGANRPLCFVGIENTCIEIKGDKRPIGGLDNSSYEFKEHVLEIETNATYYLFTDGYIDQFGGEKDKKYTTKRFKDLIENIKDTSITEKEIKISEAFANWKLKNNQTDDVLVIGFNV